MKFSPVLLIALVALFGLVEINANPVSRSSELHDVFEEFHALVPKEKVAEIFREYLEKDPQVQAVVKYMSTDGFKELITRIESIEDVINFYDYLEESGLNVYGTINKLHGIIGLPPLISNGTVMSLKMTGGVAGLLADIKAVLPVDDIKALYREKLRTSPAFAELVKRLGSPRCQELVNALRANEEFRKIVGFAKEAGVDINAIKDLLTTAFGLEFPQRTLAVNPDENIEKLLRDLSDFIDLLPVEEMTDIAAGYVFNDPELQVAIAYVRSEEFRHLVTNAEQNIEFRAFLRYLDESNLPASRYVNHVNRYLGIPEVLMLKEQLTSSSLQSAVSSGGLRGMLDAIEALLPRAAIKKMYKDKLETSEPFAFMIRRLKAPEFQAIVDELVANQNIQMLGHRAAEFGIDLNAIVDFMSKVFGIDVSEE